MCRVLLVKSQERFSIASHLGIFARLCEGSKEFQGHGWGMTYSAGGSWETYKNIMPIWEDDLGRFGQTDFLIVHARSAFQDKDIVIQNNMPFSDGRYAFVFNGELQGVKIKADGRIGAEKIFNFIRRFNNGERDMPQAFNKALGLIPKRTSYIRAMNILMADTHTRDIYMSSMFGEDPEYFTLRIKQENENLIICSQPYPDETGWRRIANNTIEVIT